MFISRLTTWRPSRKAILGSGGVILLAAALYGIYRPDSGLATGEYAEARSGTIVQKVEVTGRVKSAEEVELAFERSGKVFRAAAQKGARVKKGDVLLALEAGDLGAQVSSARAAVDSAEARLLEAEAALRASRARLDEVRQGTRTEEVAVKEAELEKARQDVSSAEAAARSALGAAYLSAYDAVLSNTEDLFTKDDQLTPELTFRTFDYQAGIDAEHDRFTAGETLKAWDSLLRIPAAPIEESLRDGKARLNSLRAFFDGLAKALEGEVDLDAATALAYKADMSLGRAALQGSLSSVTASENALSAARFTVKRIEGELALKRAGSTAEAIRAAEAAVSQAEANAASQKAAVRQAEANTLNYSAQLAKYTLRAPLGGIVTRQDAKAGAIVSPGTTLIALMSDAKYQIDARVPEADVAKMAVGQEAKVTLDAYNEEEVFSARIISVDQAATMVEGVATYTITLEFTENDSRIRPGMTANVAIETLRKENALSVPQRAVSSEGGERFVRVVENAESGVFRKAAVITGVRGSGGEVEVVSGLVPGEKVLLIAKEK